MRIALLSGLMSAALAAAAPGAVAQVWPAKPVRLVVPYTPGGSNDVLSRLVGQRLAGAIGQPVIVENRPGAGGMVGAEHVARSAPDGYTLLNIQASFATNAALRARMPYDPIEDFTPIAMLARGPLVVTVHPALPVRSLGGLIRLAHARPGEVNYGSSGSGGINHLATELFARMAGIEIVHVPYKGIAPAISDLAGGHVQLVIASLPSAGHQIQAGRLRALAVASARRSRLAPDLPTVRESGVSGYVAELWWGIAAPARLPEEVTAALSTALRTIVGSAPVGRRLAAEGVEPVLATPDETREFVRNEIARWRKVAIDARLKIS